MKISISMSIYHSSPELQVHQRTTSAASTYSNESNWQFSAEDSNSLILFSAALPWLNLRDGTGVPPSGCQAETKLHMPWDPDTFLTFPLANSSEKKRPSESELQSNNKKDSQSCRGPVIFSIPPPKKNPPPRSWLSMVKRCAILGPLVTTPPSPGLWRMLGGSSQDLEVVNNHG